MNKYFLTNLPKDQESTIYNLMIKGRIKADLASKGLDFKKIKHVINFDMPKNVIKILFVKYICYFKFII